MDNYEKRIIQEAVINQNPTKLKEVFIPSMAWDDMLILRERVGSIVIEPRFYKIVFHWLWHDDPQVARATAVLALWIDDVGFQAELFNHLARIKRRKIPFTIDYDSAEKEFNIEIPGVPGWGVSHYGRDNPETDRLLHALEKYYCRLHPEKAPQFFRK